MPKHGGDINIFEWTLTKIYGKHFQAFRFFDKMTLIFSGLEWTGQPL